MSCLAWLARGPEEWRLAYLCFGLTIVGALAAPLGGPIWWMLVAAASGAGIRAVRALLFPLANGLRRTHLAWLGATGFVLVAAGAASLWL